MKNQGLLTLFRSGHAGLLDSYTTLQGLSSFSACPFTSSPREQTKLSLTSKLCEGSQDAMTCE